MEVAFWGVRGSIPCCGPDHSRVGGNTSCVSARFGDSLVIFDAGTGIRDLGTAIKDMPICLQEIHLFLSHVHYDHIIGFPFFAPIWEPDATIHIYATMLELRGGIGHFFDKVLFNHPLFPVSLSQLRAKIIFHDIKNGEEVMIGETGRILPFVLNHPGGASGYRLEAGGKSVCYVSDTEHAEGEGLDPIILQHIKNTDLMVYDACYTEKEYQNHKGWGHSTWEEGVRLSLAAGAKRMAIYHHDPSHTDMVLEDLEQEAKRAFSGAFVARQGACILL
ncbi:MAG: MBL fold metallo-hydrolase [Proteobacteria bacterium]|nr:MBL fold metallo-hydrolase [Pseudomonadota bacterium]